MAAVVLSLNLFGDSVNKGRKHEEMIKNCTQEMMRQNKCDHKDMTCSEECKVNSTMKSEYKEGEVCTEELKHDEMMKENHMKMMDGQVCTDKCDHDKMMKGHVCDDNCNYDKMMKEQKCDDNCEHSQNAQKTNNSECRN